ncbi:MAG: glycosyltransferase family 4 protein [Symploca sp. SIO2E6]|nr:glycosyltransferase family 4 protein [Symploca sp. SIO2E6]
MTKHYIFFTRHALTQPQAHLVQVSNSANAAANLGYSTVLCFLEQGWRSFNPVSWIHPFHPRKPEAKLSKLYNLQEKLKVAPLPMPSSIEGINSKWTNSSSIVCKYYFPFHILPHTKIVHTRDWNFVKAAIKYGIPAIYEHHHQDKKRFEPEIVHNPLLQIAVTVAEPIRESMIQQGMPPGKVIKLHNGFNQVFLERHPEAAKEWRDKLLVNEQQRLIVYSGALRKFKGINLMIEVAKEMPQVQFAFAGGNQSEVQHYQQLAQEQQAPNVTFLGHIPQNQLASLLQAADILAHPHCSGNAAATTSPLKLFDYLASGTPIVATEIPPLMEFKSSSAIAGWCEPNHPTQLAQCLQHVLATHPRKIGGYTDNLDFVRQFSWENRISKILSYVEDSKRPQVIVEGYRGSVPIKT